MQIFRLSEKFNLRGWVILKKSFSSSSYSQTESGDKPLDNDFLCYKIEILNYFDPGDKFH